MREDEGAAIGVERKSVGSHAERHHQHGRRSVDSVAGRYLLHARLQERFDTRLGHAFGRAQDGEDGTGHHLDINI
jgi:hypothetical protein